MEVITKPQYAYEIKFDPTEIDKRRDYFETGLFATFENQIQRASDFMMTFLVQRVHCCTGR